MSTGPKPAIVPATQLLEEKLTQQIIGAAIEVHRYLGPGLLESAYEECLCHELTLRRLSFRRQVDLPVVYKNISLDCGYRMDLLVEDRVLLSSSASNLCSLFITLNCSLISSSAASELG